MKNKPLILLMIALLVNSGEASGTAYTFNNTLSPAFPGFPASNPLDMIVNDTLNITNGTMQISPSAGAAAATITGSNILPGGAGQIITVQSGATLSYAGTNPSGSAIAFTFPQYTYSIVNMGTISKGTGSTAFTGAAGASYTFELRNGSSIIGDLDLTSSSNILGDGAFSVNGNISNLTGFFLGATSAATYTTQGTIDQLERIHLFTGGTFTVNNAITNLVNLPGLQIDGNSTTILNAAVSGTANVDNNGTLFIGASGALNTTGDFTNNNNLNIGSNFTIGTYSSFVNTSGTLYLIGSGGITGNLTTAVSLSVGQDSTGAANSCNYTLNGTIAGTPIIRVFNGALNNSGANTITGLNTSFTMDSGTTASLGAQVNGTGTVSNSGTITIAAVNALNTSGAITNPGIITMTSNWAPNSGASGFNLTGTLNINSAAFTKPANFTYAGTINLNGTGTMDVTTGNGTTAALGIGPVTSKTFATTTALSGIPTIRVFQGSFTASTGFGVSGINTSFTVDSGATATFLAAMQGTGAIVNNGTIVLGNASSLTNFASFNNNNILTVNGNTTNNITITNNSNMTVSANMAGGGSIVNASGGTFELQSGTINNSITNNASGNFNVTGSSTTTTISNAGTTNITAALNNTGTISNTGTFTTSGTLASSGITNTSGTMTLGNTVTNTGNFINNGTLILNANLTNTGSFTTTNNFTMAGNISMPGQTLTASGSTTISGTRTLTAANYNNSGTQFYTITSPTTYDNLTCAGCAINLAGGTVNVSSNFTGVLTQSVTLTILSGASLIPPSTIVTNTSRIRVSTTPTSIIVQLLPASFEIVADPGINQKIAAVLDAMAAGNVTPQQQILLNALIELPTNAALNNAIHKLLPDFNTVDANIVVQDDTFRKIERRVASLRDGYLSPSTHTYIAGDMDYTNSMWISGFGGYTKQLSIDDNDGYKATSTGALLGFDTIVCRDNVFGIAVGFSGSDITEYSNPGFYTTTLRYHALVYGSHNPFNSTFFDWVFSGSSDNNRGIRPVFISGIDMSASADYNSTLLSGKATVSQSYDLSPHVRFTPLTSLQFTNINQDAYDESGGVAALHVNEQAESIFTLGMGGRFNFPVDEWPCYAMRELRFLLSYDAIIGTNDTTANFVIGSNSYTIANPLSKLALTVGAGITFEICDYLQFQANYDLQLRKRFIDQVGMIKLRYLFY